MATGYSLAVIWMLIAILVARFTGPIPAEEGLAAVGLVLILMVVGLPWSILASVAGWFSTCSETPTHSCSELPWLVGFVAVGIAVNAGFLWLWALRGRLPTR
jgi:hypothetical protein